MSDKIFCTCTRRRKFTTNALAGCLFRNRDECRFTCPFVDAWLDCLCNAIGKLSVVDSVLIALNMTAWSCLGDLDFGVQ